jgi:hypothetical protein
MRGNHVVNTSIRVLFFSSNSVSSAIRLTLRSRTFDCERSGYG